MLRIMKFILNEKPSKEDISEIREGLRNYNRPFLENIRDEDVALYVNDDNGKKIAGIVGRLWGNWLMVEFLWVSEPEKGKSLGSKLLSKLESYAVTQGCHASMLNTASFQAEPFYRKHGYKTKMLLENFSEDAELYYMTKPL